MMTVFFEESIAFLVLYGPRVVWAICVLIIGLRATKKAGVFLEKALSHWNVDLSLRHFFTDIWVIGLRVLLIISVASMVGIETTSFVAILWAAGLAIGLALQWSLSNFAWWVIILLFKPYVIGDFIKAGWESGTVATISVLSTVLLTPDKKTVIMPNGSVANDTIVNYSKEKQRRIDLVIGVSYDADLAQTKNIIMSVVEKNDLVLTDPAPTIWVTELADSSVNFFVRPWCKTEDYWTLHAQLLQNIKEELDKNNIEIPYPHRVVVTKEG